MVSYSISHCLKVQNIRLIRIMELVWKIVFVKHERLLIQIGRSLKKAMSNDNKQKTIYDISQVAGVSIATVSRVINNSGNVSEKTKKKVIDVINHQFNIIIYLIWLKI